ncbi:MAG: DUF3795 domain-containing protein [Spirochaetes bacterium]|nr:DUF3795 domain-containing protein [Spirochaetota bacterium]
MRLVTTITSTAIAPCGMNCALCLVNFRDKKNCDGCNGSDENKPYHCVACSIKNCDYLAKAKTEFCYSCEKFPCARLKRLDKRYREKYKMSMIENLEDIRDRGIREFVKTEKTRWKCPECGEILCVHRDACVYCGSERRI